MRICVAEQVRIFMTLSDFVVNATFHRDDQRFNLSKLRKQSRIVGYFELHQVTASFHLDNLWVRISHVAVGEYLTPCFHQLSMEREQLRRDMLFGAEFMPPRFLRVSGFRTRLYEPPVSRKWAYVSDDQIT